MGCGEFQLNVMLFSRNKKGEDRVNLPNRNMRINTSGAQCAPTYRPYRALIACGMTLVVRVFCLSTIDTTHFE